MKSKDASLGAADRYEAIIIVLAVVIFDQLAQFFFCAQVDDNLIALVLTADVADPFLFNQVPTNRCALRNVFFHRLAEKGIEELGRKTISGPHQT